MTNKQYLWAGVGTVALAISVQAQAAQAQSGSYASVEECQADLQARAVANGEAADRAQVAATCRSIVQGDLTDNSSAIIVRGVRGSVNAAIENKRTSNQIVETVVAEDVGKLPDNNVTEAISRVTGVQISRARGEGENVLIRGMPEVNTTINGTGANMGTGRSMGLNDIPAELLKSVEVYKTRTADQVEGSIGGTVNVELRRPLDLKDGLTVAGSMRGSYDSQSDKVSPYGSLLLADNFDTGIGEIGLLANISYTKAFYREDFVDSESPFTASGIALESLPDNLKGLIIPYRAKYGVEDGVRKRPSVNLVAQWKPTDELNFILEGTYFGTREKRNYSHTYMLLRDSAALSDLTLTDDGRVLQAATLTNEDGIPAGFDTIYNDFKRDYYAVNFETHWQGEGGSINAQVQYSWSNDDTYFVESLSRPYGLSEATIDFASDKMPSGAPYIEFPGFDAGNIDSYGLERFQDNQNDLSNKEFTAAVDFTVDVTPDGFWKSFQGGVRFNKRKVAKGYGYRDGLPRIDGEMTPLADFPGGDLAQFYGPEVDGAQQWLAIPGSYLMSHMDDVLDYIRTYDPNNAAFDGALPPADSGQNFHSTENSMAVFGQIFYGFELGGIPIDGVAGARLVNTWGDVRSVNFRPNEDGDVEIEDSYNKASFIDVLPSINAVAHFTPQLQLRLAYTTGVKRADFYELRPFYYVNTGATPIRVDAGNPDLKAQKSDNYDISLEYYFGRGGALTFGAFVKKPSNYLYWEERTESLAPYGYAGEGTVAMQRNAGSGEFIGFEAAATGFFEFLPGLLSNFGASVNATYIPRYKIDFPFDEATSQIPGIFDADGTSEWTGNAALYYDSDKFSARLAYNYRSKSRDGVWTGNPEFSHYTDATSRFDAAINYTPVSFMTLSLEGTNLLKNNTEMFFGKSNLLPRGIRVQARTVQGSVRFRF
ncbi:TonB-dependent receptor [Altericroceibacterium spongiae]|nr:TonB-dependent receptor [Altericroceibacterium spongiae]